MNRKPEFWDRLTPNQKLQYAIRHGKDPVRYDGEEVEAARQQEELRGATSRVANERAMKRDREMHETVTEYKGFVSRTQKYIQKRKGNIRNKVEERTLASINYARKAIKSH